MPVIAQSKYNELVSGFCKNPHIATIYAGKFKRFKAPDYQREKVELYDGDFLTVDYKITNPNKAIILCHGLEGNSQRTYINSCSDYFLKNNYSVFAWNNRTCSGEMNRLPQLYHHASIEDLDAVVQFALSKEIKELYLIGFSMGGAQILNYLGREPQLNDAIKAAVSVSVPIEIQVSADALHKGFNQVYMKNFLIGLHKKLRLKAKQFPELIDLNRLKKVKNFKDLDDNFTAPLHGFKDRFDYYYKVSPARCLDSITKPVLILNALNDTFLGEGCFPVDAATKSSNIFLETPTFGGHCAFIVKNTNYSFVEMRAFDFFESFK